MKKIKFPAVIALVLTLFFPSFALAQQRIRLATTTSTENSGLLAVLLPPFEKKYGVEVDVIAVGTGKALKLAENGDVDAVLVHAPAAEEEFVDKGFGVNRRDVMYNDFVLIGPAADPAQVRKSSDAAAALKSIARSNSPFVSRGDESGTHKKEKELWRIAGIEPEGKWYMEAGQGMGAVLKIADEKGAYTITDRGTLLAYADKLDLVILLEGDPKLYNPYGIIAVNPKAQPHADYMNAMLLIAWVTSPEGQKIIGGYKKNGRVLFVPMAVPMSEAEGNRN